MIQVVDSEGGFTGSTDLTLDDVGRPHLSYFRGVNGYVIYATWNGSSWDLQRVERGHSEGFTSIALDSTGHVHLAYAYFNGRLKHAFWNGTEWRFETVDFKVITVRYMSIAIDSKDLPHIAYFGLEELRYAVWDGTSWNVEIVDSGEDVGLDASLGLDSQDLPHIAYRDGVMEKLRYARRTGSSWTFETVDSSGDTGWDVDIAVDDLDRIHISYYERLDAELRYAYRAADFWRMYKVDSHGVVGWFTSLDLDEFGAPHISYHDWSRGSLKYATGMVQIAVRTLAPKDVTKTGAVLRGELVSLGSSLHAELSFEWRAKGDKDWRSSPPRLRLSEVIFEGSLSDLTPELQYEYRAKAETLEEVILGETVIFRTLPADNDGAITQSDNRNFLLVAGLMGFLLFWIVFAVLNRTLKKRLKP